MSYHPLLRKVVSLQRREKLIPEASRLLIAFSGGADSVALALSLLELMDFLKLEKLALAHINHQLRGEESYRDEAFCLDFARRHGLDIYVERIDVKAQAVGENLEGKARELRYEALERIREREGFHLIATAHHLRDLVETILLWLLRGAGREGLLGFEPKEGKVVRPLYLAKREEIEDYVLSRGERWVEDSTNYDLDLARNLIRHKVLPEFRKINPSFEESFLRLRSLLKEEEGLLKELTHKSIENLLKDGFINRKAFLRLHRALQRRVVYELLGVRSFKEVERVISRIRKAGGDYIDLKSLKG